jgi:hypothetical protein
MLSRRGKKREKKSEERKESRFDKWTSNSNSRSSAVACV